MATAKTSEKFEFSTDVAKILHLMINSIYTNKDIFLRELISNASDACDKRRYEALTNSKISDTTDYKIQIKFDEDKKTITISDNGIGMDKEDLIENLGTIARSGTQKFLDSLTGDNDADLQIIGQFGVGFYSSFMIANEVIVTTKKAGDKNAYLWKSKGDGKYEIETADKNTETGTSVKLLLKDGEDTYLDFHRLKFIITTYSDHISVPIELFDADDKPEIVNKSSALWLRPKSEITTEEYNEFYKNVSYLPDTPMVTLHTKAEGALEYTSLLFIPSMKPFDLFHPDRQTKIKLYINRVFITEETAEILPPYLRFVKGIVDSNDLPLNISRETLQHNHILKKIQKSLVKKIISEINTIMDKDPEKFAQFWENFGPAIKEGLCEPIGEFKEKILEICQFKSSKTDQPVTLDQYISNMPESQNEIFYITGDNIDILKSSPQIEGFIKRGIEVLLLTDNVDDFWVTVINEYKGKQLQSVVSANVNLDDIKKDGNSESKDDKKEEVSDDMNNLVAFIKENLGGKVSDVVISNKLTDSPVCLAIKDGGMSMRMERILVDNKQMPTLSAKIFEINPKHNIIRKLSDTLAKDKDSSIVLDYVDLLFDQACIIEGEYIKDPTSFASKLTTLLEKNIA